MDTVKQVVIWEPKTAEKKNASGKVEPVGKFRTKVLQGTPNAVRHTGSNAAGKNWDFWGVDVDNVHGTVRWVDVRTTDYGPVIVLFLETENRLNQISISLGGNGKTDVIVLRNIVNHLCGLKKDLATAVVNLSYWVRTKVDANGKPKLDAKDKPILAKTLMFRDVPEKFTFDEWRAFAQEHSLEWVKEKRGLDDVWNYSAEVDYWIKQVVKVQRFLLGTENVLPFCWNSVTASASDDTDATLTMEEIKRTNEIYQSVKPRYRFPFSREEVSADSVELEPPSGYNASDPFNATFPTNEPLNYEQDAVLAGIDEQDPLPF